MFPCPYRENIQLLPYRVVILVASKLIMLSLSRFKSLNSIPKQIFFLLSPALLE